jgi:hypothetical protein
LIRILKFYRLYTANILLWIKLLISRSFLEQVAIVVTTLPGNMLEWILLLLFAVLMERSNIFMWIDRSHIAPSVIFWFWQNLTFDLCRFVLYLHFLHLSARLLEVSCIIFQKF